MTLMGQRKSRSRRTYGKNGQKGGSRGNPLGRKGNNKDKEYRAFMDAGQGLPSVMSGNVQSRFLKNERGVLLPTERHHILPRSVYPEYAQCEWNTVILTREEHSWAHNFPKLFDAWFQENLPEQWKVVEEHRHHRKD